MLVKKLIVSAMGTGLLWAAGLAGHAALARHPGLLLLAGQVRLSLGDREGGLRLMQRAAEPAQASQPQAAQSEASNRVSAPARTAAAKCTVGAHVSRASSRISRSPRRVGKEQVLPAGFADEIARQQRGLVRLSLQQARMGEPVRTLVIQRMRDLPQFPAVPAEPQRANP